MADFNSVQTGRVNKEFQGVAPLNSKYGKPQSQSRISRSLHQTRTHTDPPNDTVKLKFGHSCQKCRVYCVRKICVLTGVTKRSRLYVHACMTERR